MLRADPENAVRLAKQHNDQIGDTIMQLFEQRNFPRPDDFSSVPRGQTNQFGNDWADMHMSARAALYSNHGGRSDFGDSSEFPDRQSAGLGQGVTAREDL